MILYSQRGERSSNADVAEIVEKSPIAQALRLLIRTERLVTGHGCGIRSPEYGAGSSTWPCNRKIGHLPPHGCANDERALMVWTDE